MLCQHSSLRSSLLALPTAKSWGTGPEAQTHMPAMHSRKVLRTVIVLRGA